MNSTAVEQLKEEVRLRKERAARIELLKHDISSLKLRLGTIRRSISICPPEQLDLWAGQQAKALELIKEAEDELRTLEQMQRMSLRK